MGKRARRATQRRVARCSAPIAALCVLVAVACGDTGDPAPALCPSDLPTDTDCPGAAPQYGAVISGVIEQRCQGCHYPGNPFSSQVFGDYRQLYAARRTALSRVYGCVMPPADAPPLLPEERAALLKWFVCGAPEN